MEQKSSKKARIESDLIGSREVSGSALHGVQTLRDIEDFRISKLHSNEYPPFIQALVITKVGATVVNRELNLLTERQTDATLKTCKEILEGKHHDQSPVDVIQGGAGITTNMNANEVIANHMLELMGHARGKHHYCSPNDHVNRSQSTSDAYPAVIHIGLCYTHLKLVKYFATLIEASRKRGAEFTHIIKMECTQLEDAISMTPGQTFNGFVSILEHGLKNLDLVAQDLLTVNMGATATGAGITTELEYTEECIAALCRIAGLDIKPVDDLVGATSNIFYMVGCSSAAWRVAVEIGKICNDLRLSASSPCCGLKEINLSAMQLDSSTMSGKVDPVIPEVMNQVSCKVIGNDPCVAMSGGTVQMESNAMGPVMAQCCLESADLLMNGFDTLRTLYIDGITVSEGRRRRDVHNNIGVVTTLNPITGYKHSTKIVKGALETDKGVHELVPKHNILSEGDPNMILEPENMIKPVKPSTHLNH